MRTVKAAPPSARMLRSRVIRVLAGVVLAGLRFPPVRGDDQPVVGDGLLFHFCATNAGVAPDLHWAVNGNDRVQAFSERIGYASWGSRISYRHGPLALDLHNTDHPMLRNFAAVTPLQLYDESDWKLTGRPENVTVLATSTEDGVPTPQFRGREHAAGRVLVSIPGHYSWTFDDPLFQILLLRGLAWTMREPVDRFNPLVTVGARMSR